MSRLGRSQPIPPIVSHGFVGNIPANGVLPGPITVVENDDRRRRRFEPLQPYIGESVYSTVTAPIVVAPPRPIVVVQLPRAAQQIPAVVIVGRFTTTAIVFNDSGSGTITLSAGTTTESHSHTATGSGTITFSGTGTQSHSHTASGSGTITFSGTGSGSQTATDSRNGTITFSGSGTESHTHSRSGSGTITWSGTASQSASHTGSGSGTIVLSGSGVENYVPPGGAAAILMRTLTRMGI